jgi:lipopolysaccharide transport system ATP-binding protein
MKPIIKVENLSKQYTLGGPAERYSTIRESLIKTIKTPFSGSKKAGNGSNTFWALKDITFDVMPGEVVGIIGRNGAGKSTLLKVLSRITEPTAGRAELYGRVGSLLEVGTGFHPELTGRENIFLNGAILGMSRDEIAKKFDAIVDFAEVEKFLDTPVKRYSSGMYVRLAFAVAAHLEPEILIVDEVLAVGDSEFQKKCLGKIKDVSEHGRTVLFVSHNMTAVATLCSKGILLSQGEIQIHSDAASAINLYTSTTRSNYREFTKMLKWAEITQVGDHLELSCEYDNSVDIRTPFLGFVISNTMGAPIFGSNPEIEALGREFCSGSQRKVKVKIIQPKLLDGEYLVSLWFGDGQENFFEERDALSIEIAGMTSKKQYPHSVVGNVAPQCEWTSL